MHLCQTYSHRIRFSEKLSPEESMEIFEDTDSRVSVASNDGWTKLMPPMRKLIDPSIMTFASDLQSIADYFDTYYQSKLMTNAFTDSLFTIPREFPTNFDLLFDFYLRGTKPIAIFFCDKGRSIVTFDESFGDPVFDKIDVPSQPVYHGDVNAFVLEIFAMKDQIKRRWSRNFMEAAFECFPDLDYCVILLPFSHPYFPLLQHFVVYHTSY